MNPSIQPYTYDQFKQIASEKFAEFSSKDTAERKRYERTVKAVNAEQRKEEEAKRHSKIQTASEANSAHSALIAAVSSLTEKFNGMAPKDISYNNEIKPFRIGEPAFMAATQQFQQSGNSVVDQVYKKFREDRIQRNKPEYMMKTVDDPNAIIKYYVDGQGNYKPASSPIDFAPYIQLRKGRTVIADRMSERLRYHCFRCGEVFCGNQARNCIYNTPENLTWEICGTCRMGYHAAAHCKANKPLRLPKN